MPSTAFISLGSNIGNRRDTCFRALLALTNTPEIDLTATSSYYESEALTLKNASKNSPEQAPYLNQVIEIETTLSCEKLLQCLQDIEKKFGRIRKEKWGPRTLDLDILYYDNLVSESSELTIPHPEISNRSFIIRPLMEIAPHLQDPKRHKTINALYKEIPEPQKVVKTL